MESETACLILNTFDINPSLSVADYNGKTIDNQYGTITDNKCNLTWKNVNMRRVLGTMYDKYETFNLYLYQIAQSQPLTTTLPFSASNSLVDIEISGLQFLNNGYNCVTGNNTNSAFLTSYVFNTSTTAGILTPMFNPSIVTFGKSVECIDININMLKTHDRK